MRSTAARWTAFASVNGRQVAAHQVRISAWDPSFLRGDGIFEVLKVVEANGTAVPRALKLHLDRLERSAKGLELALPPREDLTQWLRQAAKEGGPNGYVRVAITRGAGGKGYGDHLAELDAPPQTIMLWQPMDPKIDKPRSLCPLVAPWHPAGLFDKWRTSKWLSYGANVHATRLAQQLGFDDALLLARGHGIPDEAPDDDPNRVILDGPRFAVAWLDNGLLCTPHWQKLGMLESITTTLVLEAAKKIGIPVAQDIFRLNEVQDGIADAMWILSTTSNMAPVSRVGEDTIPPAEETRAAILDALPAVAASFDEV